MQTASGFSAEDPLELLLGFVKHWYLMYDGVEVAQDHQLRVMEIALSTMLNSRISGNTGEEIWRKARTTVEAFSPRYHRISTSLTSPPMSPFPVRWLSDKPLTQCATSSVVNLLWLPRYCTKNVQV